MDIVQQLTEALASNCLVSVHSNPNDPDACSVGYVDTVTSIHVRLRSVTPRGQVMGYEVRRLEDVHKVETDGPYERRVAKLVSGDGQVFSDARAALGRCGDLITDMVETARDGGHVVTLFLPSHDDDVTGYVTMTTDLRVTVSPIHRFGADMEAKSIPWRDVQGVDFETEEEQIRRFINKD